MRRFGVSNFLRNIQSAATASSSAGATTSSSSSTTTSSSASIPKLTSFSRLASSTEKKDFYEVLGVAKGASDADIKKAYRKKAMETHPDRPGGNKDMFAKVGEAYECLSDPQKRQMYDQYGAEAANMGGFPGGAGGAGMGGMGGFGGRSAEDIFADFFRSAGGGNPFGGGGDMGGGAGPRRQRVSDIDTVVTCSLEEIYTGVTKTIRVNRPTLCGSCKGSGSNKGTAGKKKCTTCNGSGREVQQIRMGPGMVQQLVQECRRCNGSGKTIAKEDQCASCHSEGFAMKAEELSIHIPPGIPDGATLVMRGMAGEIPDADPGDINIQVQMRPHAQFKRMGKDLVVSHTCTLSEALLGMELRLTMPDGRTVVATSPANTVLKSNTVLTFPGLGMPASREAGGGGSGAGSSGNLYINVSVKMPATLTKDQKEKLQEILGAPSRDKGAPENSRVAGKIMTQSWEELSRAKAGEWDSYGRASGGGNGGNGGRGRRGGGGGGGAPGGGAECVQQ